MNVAILEEMPELDFKTPFDELGELRAVLTTQQIAELTGLRRETISRARPDSRFRRRTEKALGDLYLVITRMRSILGDDLGQPAAVLRRPQQELGGRSIADLLREGQVEVVLESLSAAASTERERLEALELDPETMAELRAIEDEARGAADRSVATVDPRVSAVLDADPELASRVEEIEARIDRYFGRDATVRRAIAADYTSVDGPDRLHLRVRAGLSVDEEIERLAELLKGEEALLGPVRDRLTIGVL